MKIHCENNSPVNYLSKSKSFVSSHNSLYEELSESVDLTLIFPTCNSPSASSPLVNKRQRLGDYVDFKDQRKIKRSESFHIGNRIDLEKQQLGIPKQTSNSNIEIFNSPKPIITNTQIKIAPPRSSTITDEEKLFLNECAHDVRCNIGARFNVIFPKKPIKIWFKTIFCSRMI